MQWAPNIPAKLFHRHLGKYLVAASSEEKAPS